MIHDSDGGIGGMCACAEWQELMTQHTMFSPNFVRKAVSGVRPPRRPARSAVLHDRLTCLLRLSAFQFYTWFDELLQNSWEACQVRTINAVCWVGCEDTETHCGSRTHC